MVTKHLLKTDTTLPQMSIVIYLGWHLRKSSIEAKCRYRK